jgi:hypothetical protein
MCGQRGVIWTRWTGPCRLCVIPMMMAMFRVHLLIYQQLELPEARSWAASCQGRACRMLWQCRWNGPSITLFHSSPLAKPDWTPCWAVSLRLSASVNVTGCGQAFSVNRIVIKWVYILQKPTTTSAKRKWKEDLSYTPFRDSLILGN